MSSKKDSPRRSNKKRATPDALRLAWWHKPLWLLLKVALLLLVVLAFYFLYLDSKISKKFSGQKWQVPAQIYAKSIELYPGKIVTQQQFIQQLDALQYRRNSALSAAGQYSVSRNHVSVYRRPFMYVEGYEAAQLFSVEFNRGGINRITQRKQKQALNFARLEPQ